MSRRHERSTPAQSSSRDVLSQEEIDALLIGFCDNCFKCDRADCSRRMAPYAFNNLKSFRGYLADRRFQPEKPYGMFSRDTTVTRFFDKPGNEKLLADNGEDFLLL